MGDTGGSQDNHRQRNPQHTRQALLKAACRLFSTHGFSSTTMRQIAETDTSHRVLFLTIYGDCVPCCRESQLAVAV
ncbi:TetR/AcrR family transcriptional regulator [Bifidobacterium aquikefiri]|uniref:HTH tetR-type domain-containing protein n=2 Tax=Bifidobacterium aquikefiri TaxID=1653207 RepID=A0A261G119_9BIFI|nr:hypothetical protein BAQU_1861 [Bifidobacterium aquikefiri]